MKPQGWNDGTTLGRAGVEPPRRLNASACVGPADASLAARKVDGRELKRADCSDVVKLWPLLAALALAGCEYVSPGSTVVESTYHDGGIACFVTTSHGGISCVRVAP